MQIYNFWINTNKKKNFFRFFIASHVFSSINFHRDVNNGIACHYWAYNKNPTFANKRASGRNQSRMSPRPLLS